MTDTTLDQRVQDAARDALQLVARNPAADRDVAARLVAGAVLAELHRQPVTVPPWAAIATASAPWGTCQDCGAAAGPDCDCPPQGEQQPGEAPRSALSAPQTAEHPAPGPERHPGGENGPHTGTQRAELCRQFKDAITRRWDVAPFVIDEIVDDAVDCHLDLVARATAELRAELAIDTQVMEKADRECDEHIAAGRAFRQLAERTQAWGEQHRDRANRYRARVDRVRALHVRNQNTGHCEHCSERDYPDYAVPHPCPTIRALDAPQAGDDTTGDTP